MNFNRSHTQEICKKSDQYTSLSNCLKLVIKKSLKTKGHSYITHRGIKIGWLKSSHWKQYKWDDSGSTSQSTERNKTANPRFYTQQKEF